MNFLDLIFPPKCEVCGMLGNYLCDNCYNELKKYEICNKHNNEKNIRTQDQFFLYKYEGKIRDLLIGYKFNDKAYLSNLFEKNIIKNKKACNFFKSCDIITPVPLHRKRKLERGYNQSELIVKKLVKDIQIQNIQDKKTNKVKYKQVNIKFNGKLLIKQKNTKPQSLKNLNQRINDIKGAYSVNSNEIMNIQGKQIVLFDDIYTTGSTCKECTKLLYEAGASKVSIFCIARDFMK